MSGGNPEPSKECLVIPVWSGGVDSGNPPELLEVNIPYPYSAVVNCILHEINDLKGRVKELENEVVRLKEEVEKA